MRDPARLRRIVALILGLIFMVGLIILMAQPRVEPSAPASPAQAPAGD